jgi:hypothetical protein
MARFPRDQFIDPTHITRRVVVDATHVVYFRAILEANNGVAAVYSESGGDLTLVTSACRSQELDNLLSDLKRELGAAWLVGPLV